ncbi:MAG TPA: type II secretion system F family protein [Planctomycetota bacterium]|nr:type II secretion system F family protein [Planctomycetota bacterium]
MWFTELLVQAAAFGAAAAFVVAGIAMFSKGWEGYEGRYIKGAERRLDDLYLTIPTQHLIYLSVLAFLLLAMLMGTLTGSILLGFVFGLLGLLTPEVLVRFLRRRRRDKFGDQLVDALMTMSNALRTGFSLPQAFQLVQREMDDPISQEFRLMNTETRIGVPMEEAMQHMLERIPSQDLDLVVTAINISREVGGNLTEVFDNISATIRERHRLEGKIKSLTAMGKMQAGIICSLPILMVLVLNFTNPELMQPMFNTPLGWLLFAAIVVLEIAGILVIRKIVNIDV